jgi:hypothetical protein
MQRHVVTATDRAQKPNQQIAGYAVLSDGTMGTLDAHFDHAAFWSGQPHLEMARLVGCVPYLAIK